MPSFLSKLLGRKKGQEPDSPSDKRSSPTLLDGKFEAVSPTVSPSAALFTDPTVAQIRGNDKAKDKESPFNLLRYKSRPSSDCPTTEKSIADVPHLSLTLPVTKDRGRALDVVFEPGNEAGAILIDTAIREKRISPNEALSLMRSCSQVIIERGLDTLGIMHPHWYSASLEVQHRLISLYILSLASNSAATAAPTASPTSLTTSATFESQLHYAHSPHDVAAVLRWGLRHLKLDGANFGRESGDWTWYNTFVAAERTGSFPSDAFSKSLIPQLPPSHAELLLATLDIISSLSAHGEANGCSGSRLSKFFGLWLLTAEHSLDGDDWTTFYDRWDRAGRILEHLFLARIRDEAQNLPRRLTELVDQYPYASGANAWDDNLLPRPRFSTRDYDALLVRLDTEYTGALKPKSHPLRLIADALRAQSAAESASGEDADLWEAIKKASLIPVTPEGPSDLAPTEPVLDFSNIFSDETIRLLSLIPMDVSEKSRPTPTFVLLSPLSTGRPRSSSFPDSPRSPTQADNGRTSSSGQPVAIPSLNANPNTAPTTAAPVTPTDWLQFTNQGFGATSPTRDLVATLWDNDVEVTVPAPTPAPAPLSRKSSRRAHSRRSSVDSPSAQTPMSSLPSASPPLTSKATLITKVKLNEAFVDFWTDALLDPISKPWLRFVLCQLKPLPSVVTSPNPTPTWLIIEQRFVRLTPALPPKEEVEAHTPTTPPRPRASSPRPSLRAETSRLSAAFSFSPKMRFGFFSGGSGDSKSPNEKSARLSQVGELGESVKGTRDAVAAIGKPKESDAGAKDNIGGDMAAGAVAVTAASAVAVAAIEEIPLAPSTEDASPALVDEAVPSVSTKIGALVGDQSTTPQKGPAQDGLIEEQRTPVPASNGGLPSTTTSEPATTQTESPVSELKASQPTVESDPPAPHLAGISEEPIPQPELVAAAAAEITPPSDEVSAPPEPTPVAEESSAVPLVEATETAVPPAFSDSSVVDSTANGAVDEIDAPATGQVDAPEPTVEDPVAATSNVDNAAELASVVAEPKSADTSTSETVPAAAEDQPIPALDTVRASDASEPVNSTRSPPTDTEAYAQDLSTETTADVARERIALEETQAAQHTVIPVVEEVPSAEQPAPVSEAVSAPVDEPALPDEPSSLDKDGIDVAPIVVGITETVSVAEESEGSSVLKPTLEGSEQIVTKSENGSSAAEPEITPSIVHDSEEPLHTFGSAQHVIDEPTTTSVDESVVSRPAVEETAVVDSVEEQLANTSEPEPLVEGAATPTLEETVTIAEESADPTAVKVETPSAVEDSTDASMEAPALVAEPAPIADVATLDAADALAEPTVEKPLPSVGAEVTSETSIPVPAENEPFFSFEAAPAEETPVKTLTPVIDEPGLTPQTDPLITAEISTGTSAEEPVHVTTEVAPAAEIPVETPPATGEADSAPQASTSVEEGPVGILAAAVEEPSPVAEVATLSAEIIAEAQATVADESIPLSHESTPDAGALVDAPAPTTDHLAPTEEASQASTSGMETSALVVEESHVAEEAIPTAETPVDTPVSEAEQSILVTDEAVHDAETPAAEIRAPVTEEPDHISQPAAPIPVEPEVPTETLVPAAEERTEDEPPLIPEAAPNADHSTEAPAVAAEAVPDDLTCEAPPLETVPPPAEEYVSAVPEEAAPATTEAVPEVDAAPVAEDPAPVPTDTPSDVPMPVVDELVPQEEAVPAIVEHSAETSTPVAVESTTPAIEQAAIVTAETPATPTTPTIEDSIVTTPAETPAPVPGEPAPLPEESAPEVSTPTPDADQPLSQKEPAVCSTEEQDPSVEEPLSETVVSEPLTEQVAQEPVLPVDEEAPATALEEPAIPEPESIPAPEMDAHAEVLVSNGNGAHNADPGHEPEPDQKPATELDPAVTDETLDGDA